MNLDEIRAESGKLSALMADPQPGLYSWLTALDQTIERLAILAGCMNPKR